ncbi:MAG: hypothetical protein ACYTHM_12420 [Planctomycetota bacterium]
MPGPEALLFAGAGFALAGVFLLSLYVQVRRIVADGRMPLFLPLVAAVRVGLAGGGIGVLVCFGPWACVAGIFGFAAGRTVLGPIVARRFQG